MDTSDLTVLTRALDWWRAGHGVVLATVAQTTGSAPRRPGALCAIRGDGALAGSVSGGCVENEWIERLRAGEAPARPVVADYGAGRGKEARPHLSCGGTLRLVVERIGSGGWIEEILLRTAERRRTARLLDLADGSVEIREAAPAEATRLEAERLVTIFGAPWRLLLIGADEVSRVLAEMARLLGFEVFLCDPREKHASAFSLPGVRYLPGMPDEAVSALPPDPRTAVVALSHDTMLDDMALLSALKSEAFFVGALGSRSSADRRRRRLAPYFFPEELDRLSSPAGLDLGTHEPGEIAVAILAEMIAVRNRVLPSAADSLLFSPKGHGSGERRGSQEL